MGSKNSKVSKKSNSKKLFRIVIATFLIVGSVTLGMLASTIVKTIDVLNHPNPNGNKVGETEQQSFMGGIFDAMTPMSEPVTLLFLGSDVGYTSKGKKDESIPTRSDSMILTRIDPIEKKVTALSIPRDTRVTIPEKNETDKINAAFAYGGEKLARKTVANFTGVPIQHYVILKVDGLVNIIDALGGIDIFIDKDMNYKDWTAKLFINLPKGQHHLNGRMAHQYLRFRHDELGDIGRVQRQQKFVDALTRKLLNPAIMLKLPELVEIAQKNVISDFSNGELLKIANFLRKLKRTDIKMLMLPGRFATIDGGSYWVSEDYQIKDAVKGLFPDSQLNLPDPNATQSPDPLPNKDLSLDEKRNIKLTVLNGTNESGLGAKAARLLRDQGWVVWTVEQADNTDTKITQVILQTGKNKAVPFLKNELGLKNLDVVHSSTGDISTDYTVIVGKDFLNHLNEKQGNTPSNEPKKTN